MDNHPRRTCRAIVRAYTRKQQVRFTFLYQPDPNRRGEGGGEVWEQADLKETRRHGDTLGYISPHRHFYCGPSTRKCFHGNTDSPTCSSTILTRDPFDFLWFFFLFFFWYLDWRFLQSRRRNFWNLILCGRIRNFVFEFLFLLKWIFNLPWFFWT